MKSYLKAVLATLLSTFPLFVIFLLTMSLFNTSPNDAAIDRFNKTLECLNKLEKELDTKDFTMEEFDKRIEECNILGGLK